MESSVKIIRNKVFAEKYSFSSFEEACEYLQAKLIYSFVRIEKNFYSVPDYLVEHEITARTYVDKIYIYSNNQLVCVHEKVDGVNEISIDIRHYLSTLTRKPLIKKLSNK